MVSARAQGSIRGRSRQTPFGLPVVPDEYVSTAPAVRSLGGLVGSPDNRSSWSMSPATEPPTATSSLAETRRARSSARSA